MSYRALLIGNSVFDQDAGLNPLNAPVKDVARFHRALVDADTGLFDDDLVRLVTERTCDDILDELDRFFAAGGKDDLLLLYYSGHGVLDERNNLYLCGRDTRSDRLLRTAVSNVRINEFVAQSTSQRIVIVLDCCSSGMFKAGASVGPQLAGPGRYIVSSTRGARLANDAATATGTSLFTEHFVEGMLGAATDVNGDGYLDLREIYDYVRDRLLATTKQVPHCRFDGDAAVSLARVRRAPAVASVGPEARVRTAEPTFALAENTITLRDVAVDERLAPEIVEVIPLGDEPLDLVAHTADDWLEATVSADEVTVVLHPRPGRNRGKVTIRDRNSGSAQVLRVEAHVQPVTAALGAATGATTKAPVAAEGPVAEAPVAAAPAPAAPVAETPAARASAGDAAEPDARSPAVEPPPGAPGRPLVRRLLRRPAGRPPIGWFGLGLSAVGALLLVTACSSLDWYRTNEGTGGASELHDLASGVRAGLAQTWFGGLDWVVIAGVVACGAAACLPMRLASAGLARAAAFFGAVGIGLTLGGLAQLWDAVQQADGASDLGVFKHTTTGFWLALAGFVLAGVAGFVRGGRPDSRR